MFCCQYRLLRELAQSQVPHWRPCPCKFGNWGANLLQTEFIFHKTWHNVNKFVKQAQICKLYHELGRISRCKLLISTRRLSKTFDDVFLRLATFLQLPSSLVYQCHCTRYWKSDFCEQGWGTTPHAFMHLSTSRAMLILATGNNLNTAMAIHQCRTAGSAKWSFSAATYGGDCRCHRQTSPHRQCAVRFLTKPTES